MKTLCTKIGKIRRNTKQKCPYSHTGVPIHQNGFTNTGTSVWVHRHVFQKRNTFCCETLFALLDKRALPKWGLPFKKRFCIMGERLLSFSSRAHCEGRQLLCLTSINDFLIIWSLNDEIPGSIHRWHDVMIPHWHWSNAILEMRCRWECVQRYISPCTNRKEPNQPMPQCLLIFTLEKRNNWRRWSESLLFPRNEVHLQVLLIIIIYIITQSYQLEIPKL